MSKYADMSIDNLLETVIFMPLVRNGWGNIKYLNYVDIKDIVGREELHPSDRFSDEDIEMFKKLMRMLRHFRSDCVNYLPVAGIEFAMGKRKGFNPIAAERGYRQPHPRRK